MEMGAGAPGSIGKDEAAFPTLTSYYERRNGRGEPDLLPVELRDALSEPEDEFGLAVAAALEGKPDIAALVTSVAEHCLVRRPGQPALIDARGGAFLQEALSYAFRSGVAMSVAEMAREMVARLESVAPGAVDVKGKKLNEVVSGWVLGARAAAAYLEKPPVDGAMRFAAIDVDVSHSTDYVEALFDAQGRVREVRLVQVKAGEKSALSQSGDIHRKHEDYVTNAPNAMRRIAEAQALANLHIGGQEAPPEDAVAAMVQAAEALAASPEAPVPATLAAPMREYARRGGTGEDLSRVLHVSEAAAAALLSWATAPERRLSWLSAGKLVSKMYPNVIFAPMNPPKFESVVVAGNWRGEQILGVSVVSRRTLDLKEARAKDAARQVA